MMSIELVKELLDKLSKKELLNVFLGNIFDIDINFMVVNYKTQNDILVLMIYDGNNGNKLIINNYSSDNIKTDNYINKDIWVNNISIDELDINNLYCTCNKVILFSYLFVITNTDELNYILDKITDIGYIKKSIIKLFNNRFM